MLGAAVATYFLVRSDPSWFYSVIPEGLAGGRDPSASASYLRSTLYGGQQNWLATFAAYLFTHNSQVAIFAFALGFAFAVPTVGPRSARSSTFELRSPRMTGRRPEVLNSNVPARSLEPTLPVKFS